MATRYVMAPDRESADVRFGRFCKSGDPEALGDVFDDCAGRLLRVACWLAGNRPDADDLLQRTFLKAIETREQFRSDEPVLPWLMGLLGNEARRQRRERGRVAHVHVVRDRVVDPEVAVAEREFADTVRSVGDRLGTPYDEVLRLHLEAGLNCKEIAQRLHRPSGTVRTQLMRALDLLRRRLPTGFAAGMARTAKAGTGSMAQVRAAVVSAAKGVAPGGGSALLAAVCKLAVGTKTKSVLLAVCSLALFGGVVAMVPSRYELRADLPQQRLVASQQEAQEPISENRSSPPAERELRGDTPQDPVPIALPRLFLLGTKSADEGAIVLNGDGRRGDARAPDSSLDRVVLRIDRFAPWGEVSKLLDQLRMDGKRKVLFAAQLPSGREGCFALALPANDQAGAALGLRLHRERPGVPPSSIVPILRRIVRGREGHLAGLSKRARKEMQGAFPEPFTISVAAPDDAPFEQVLRVVAAAHDAGIRSVLLSSSGGGDEPRTAVGRVDAYAIDLGPCPRIALPPRALPPAAIAVADGLIGCVIPPSARPPEQPESGAGGRYGSRGDTARGVLAPSLSEVVSSGLSWLTSAQQPDGSLLGHDGRPDLDATSLAMLAMLGESTLVAGSESEPLSRGIGWIIGQQRDDGCFSAGGPDGVRLHALATYALAEAYGLSFRLELRGSLNDALAWLVAQRQDDGGFPRAVGGLPSDNASTVLAIMALATAEYFGWKSEVTSVEAATWFDKLAEHLPSESDPASSIDATALASEAFSLFFVGKDPRRQQDLLPALQRLPGADPRSPICCFWVTCCLFQVGGEPWKLWRERLTEVAELQVDSGPFKGSWQSADGLSRGATTALRVLALQGSYRYSRLFR